MRSPTIPGSAGLLVVLAVGCNALFGLDAGKPRPDAGAGRGGTGGSPSGGGGRGGTGNASGSDTRAGEGGDLPGGDGGTSGSSGAAATGGRSGSGGSGGAGGAGHGGSGGKGETAGSPPGGEAGTTADGGEGGQPSDPRPLASIWALWKMPNPASTTLPNRAVYDTTTPGVVLDTVTRLMWERDPPPSTARTWDDAVTYCNDLTLAGFDDFRVPSRIELVSILDFTATPLLIDTQAFHNTVDNLYWTTSAWPSIAGHVYAVWFGTGFTSSSDRGTSLPVRCVR